MASELTPSRLNDFLLYKTPTGNIEVEIFLHNENLWLNQAQIASLFGVDRSVITKHLKNIYDEAELPKEATSAFFAHVQKEGDRDVTRKIEFYNLDAIISVGYRVNSRNATLFRMWATERLKEYIIKGFTMNDERLKNPNQPFGKDYFDEQLARIRDIRSSERRFYQKITDIYAKCSTDYDPTHPTSKTFFATVQNKLHFAITGQTAAEIIQARADHTQDNMGLKTWKQAPKGMIRKTDVGVAKNYLNEDELEGLNRIVTMYLDFAEFQAQNKQAMSMNDWAKKLDAFLQFNERDILTHSGKVSHEVALALAEQEYEAFHGEVRRVKDAEGGEFENVVKRLPKSVKGGG